MGTIKWQLTCKSILQSDRCTYVEWEKETPVGVLSPLDGDFKPYYEMIKYKGQMRGNPFFIDLVGERTHVEKRPSGAYSCEQLPWYPMSKEHLEANKYWDAVEDLHKGPAGYKATELLKEFLNEKQRHSLDKRGRFIYAVSPRLKEQRIKGKDIYVAVCKGIYGFTLNPLTVTKFEKGVPRVGFCWHPEEPVPPADIILSTILQLSHDTKGYLTEANW